MTELSTTSGSLSSSEQPIYERLLELREELNLLKQDKSCHVKSPDVMKLYDAINDQVHQLNELRKSQGKNTEQNRVDKILDDCYQLLSLFFLTVGRKNEAPAIYALGSTMKRLLDHLKEAAFFQAKDLQSINTTLEMMHRTLRNGEGKYSPHLIVLLDNRLETIRLQLSDLRATLADLSPELTPTHEKLVSILRSISAANTRAKFPAKEVHAFQDELKKIQSAMVDGKFLANDNSTPAGQNIVTELLTRCLKWADIVLAKEGKLDERFQDVYDKLRDIRNALERLSLTQAWSLRETDLYSYQRQLDQIDESRVNGNFEDSTGGKADIHTQRTLLHLLRRSYAYIYTLMISSEPVSEALLPVYNQLQTTKRCLLEVQRAGGVSSARELYPYSMKLNSIEQMRVDGKFTVNGDVPEGQGSVNTVLAECFELAYGLRINAQGGV